MSHLLISPDPPLLQKLALSETAVSPKASEPPVAPSSPHPRSSHSPLSHPLFSHRPILSHPRIPKRPAERSRLTLSAPQPAQGSRLGGDPARPGLCDGGLGPLCASSRPHGPTRGLLLLAGGERGGSGSGRKLTNLSSASSVPHLSSAPLRSDPFLPPPAFPQLDSWGSFMCFKTELNRSPRSTLCRRTICPPPNGQEHQNAPLSIIEN